MLDFREPFGLDIVKGRGADDRETDQKDIGLRVREWPKSIIILLPSSIPQSQADWFSIHHDTRRIIVEAVLGVNNIPGKIEHAVLHCRDIFPRKCIGSIGYEEAGLCDI